MVHRILRSFGYLTQITDSTEAGNNSRFTNHSCEPNAETQNGFFYFF